MKTKRPNVVHGAGDLISYLKDNASDNSIDELFNIATWSMDALQELAIKNDCAANAVLIAYRDMLEQFNKIHAAGPIRKQAHNYLIWPAFIGVDNDLLNFNEELIEYLQLGADVPIKPRSKTGKNWSRKTPETYAALETILILARRNRWENFLPPLSQETYKQWHKAAKPIFDRKYGKDCENHTSFADRYKPTPANLKLASKKGQIFSTWKRNQITSKFEQAFKTLAVKKPSILPARL